MRASPETMTTLVHADWDWAVTDVKVN